MTTTDAKALLGTVIQMGLHPRPKVTYFNTGVSHVF